MYCIVFYVQEICYIPVSCDRVHWSRLLPCVCAAEVEVCQPDIWLVHVLRWNTLDNGQPLSGSQPWIGRNSASYSLKEAHKEYTVYSRMLKISIMNHWTYKFSDSYIDFYDYLLAVSLPARVDVLLHPLPLFLSFTDRHRSHGLQSQPIVQRVSTHDNGVQHEDVNIRGGARNGEL